LHASFAVPFEFQRNANEEASCLLFAPTFQYDYTSFGALNEEVGHFFCTALYQLHFI
jgi:hypothetical protein